MERKGRKIIVIRHGERVDTYFKKQELTDWLHHAFDDQYFQRTFSSLTKISVNQPENETPQTLFAHNRWFEKRKKLEGNYVQFHENMPESLPRRNGDKFSWWKDGPLTKHGYKESVKMGEMLKNNGLKADHIYTSAALRSIETATGLAEGMGIPKVPLNIDPALFEWGSWFKNEGGFPALMEWADLAHHGYSVNMEYQQTMDGPEIDCHESVEDFYRRNHAVVQRALETHTEDCTIMFVAHKASVDSCTRILTSNKIPTEPEFFQVLECNPRDCYLISSLASENPTNSSWNIVKPPNEVNQYLLGLGCDWRSLIHRQKPADIV